jgi:hypothetical protein
MKTPFTEKGYSQYGAHMGRRNIIPADYSGEKLHLRRVPLDRGGYDPGGAYWGNGSPLWCAWGQTATEQMQCFVRAKDRREAKSKIADLVMLQCNPMFHR